MKSLKFKILKINWMTRGNDGWMNISIYTQLLQPSIELFVSDHLSNEDFTAHIISKFNGGQYVLLLNPKLGFSLNSDQEFFLHQTMNAPES